jgi:hypothetical protein
MHHKLRNRPNVRRKSKAELEDIHGKVWSVAEVAKEFVISAIIGNTVVVRRKADDVVGRLDFEGEFYFDFRQSPRCE